MGNKKNMRVLIMKGGGIKGLAYVGALEILGEYYSFDWYAGTSAGAVAASLLASGYTTEELKEILGDKDFNDFKDAGFIKKIWNFLTKGGLYEAFTFKQWLNRLLGDKLDTAKNVRLADLPSRITIYASKRGQSAIVFDSLKRPDVPVSHAARSSMSIPFIFTPERQYGINVYDGGVQNNYPVGQVLQLAEEGSLDFIGFYLGPERFEEEKASNNAFGIFKDLIRIWTEAVDVENLEKYEDKTVVIDPRPISTLKFKLNDIEKDFLLECGRVSAIKFLRRKKLIDENHLLLKNFDERQRKLEDVRKSLKAKYRFKKILKRTLRSIFLGLIFIICFFGLNQSRRECLISNFNDNNQHNSKLSYWDRFVSCISPMVDDTTTVKTELKKISFSMGDDEVVEGETLRFPIKFEEPLKKGLNLKFNIEHIDTDDEFFYKTKFEKYFSEGTVSSMIEINTKDKNHRVESIKKFKLEFYNLDSKIVAKYLPEGIIKGSEKPSDPIPIKEKAFISGRVIDENGKGVSFATVRYESFAKTEADESGFFKLNLFEVQCGDYLRITAIHNQLENSAIFRTCRDNIRIIL